MSTRSRERLGLSLAPSKRISIDDLVALVTLAEDLGYESFWLPETWAEDIVSTLAVLARATSRILIAAGVINVYSRSPALVAQTAAALQRLSGHRFILGLGASGPTVIERWHGGRYERPIGRTQEYVEIVRLALSGERVEYEGHDLRLQGFKLGVGPVRPVPIYIAALGPRNISLTGRIADGWLPIFAARVGMEPLFHLLHRAARAAGRDPAAVDVAAYLPALVGSRGDRLLRQQLAYYVGGMGTFYFNFLARLGFENAARVRELWQRGDRVGAAEAVDGSMLAMCTLGSDTSDAIERLSAYRERGVELPIVALPYGSSVEEAAHTIRCLAPEAA